MSEPIMDLIFLLKSKCYITDDQIRSKTPLSPSEYRGLTSISTNEDLSVAEFSARMGLSASRGSRVIEKMIQNGYLKRQSTNGDRRTVLISIASRGRTLKEQIMASSLSVSEK